MNNYLKNSSAEKCRRIYADLRMNKFLNIKETFNDILLYNSLLEESKAYIPKKEYKKLKTILNKKLNTLFLENSVKSRLRLRRKVKCV